MLYIEGFNLPTDVKLRMVLTVGVVIDKFNSHVELLTEEELFLISGAMLKVPVENYEIYADVVSNHKIVKSTIDKTENFDDRMNIYTKVLNYCDRFVEPNMNEDVYRNSIKDCLNIVEDYKTKEKSARTM